MGYKQAVSCVSNSTGLSKKMVDRIYKAYWKAVREYVSALPFEQDLSDEDFMQLRPCVNIPSIGKLYVTLNRYKTKKKHFTKFSN